MSETLHMADLYISGMKNKGISVQDLLEQIPSEVFEKLSQESKVDYQVKKLTGQRIFILLLHGLLSGKELSFRILEQLFKGPVYQSLVGGAVGLRTDHSSISDRLAVIRIDFFKGMFEHVSSVFSERFSSEEVRKYRLVRFDSTMISLSAKLLHMDAIRTGDHKKTVAEGDHCMYVKFSVGFDGMTVRQIKFFQDQNHLSENVALLETIQQTALSKNDIAVFDKGITRRQSYEQFTQSGIQFVTRIKADKAGSKRLLRYEKLRDFMPAGQQLLTPSLRIIEDAQVYLFDQKYQKIETPFRLIKAVRIENDEPINFLTNIEELSVEEVTEVYRLRWEIEVFFKFLKQELDFKHFLSRNKNGLQVMMYMTAIAAMLIYVFRKLNQIEGFKIAKLQFINELEREVIRIAVELCQGNLEIFQNLFPLRE